MDVPDISIIISFYNKLDRLKLVLASLELQSYSDFEVIIADDGSSQDLTAELAGIIQSNDLTIRHIWHEDLGWRKNTILNKSILASRSNYLVFIDGDCILHPRFLEEHFHHKNSGWVLAGRRVNLSPSISASLTNRKIRRGVLWRFLLFKLAWQSLIHRNLHFENAIYVRSPFIRARINKKEKGILGSNF